MQVRVGVPALPAEDQILFQIIEGDRRSVAIASLGDTLGQARDLGVHGADWISSIIAPDGQSVIVGVPAVSGGKQSMSMVDLASMTDTPIVVEPDVAWQRVARQPGSGQLASASQRWGLDRSRSRPHSSQNASQTARGAPSQRSSAGSV